MGTFSSKTHWLLSLSIGLNIFLLLLGGTLVYSFRNRIYERFFPSENTTILILGDSMLAQENWSLLLHRNDLNNHAFGGAITQHLLWNLQRGELNNPPKICILNGGINDLLSGIPPQRIFQNYQQIIALLQEKQVQIIINSILTTTNNSRLNQTILALNQQLKAYSEQKNCTFIDINSLFSTKQKGLNPTFARDSIHLKSRSYTVWAKEVRRHLR